MSSYKLDLAHVKKVAANDMSLWLPYGFRFANSTAHNRGFETMTELRKEAKNNVVECSCDKCKRHLIFRKGL